MQINRTYSGKLNQDSSKYSLPATDYPNARNISKDSRSGYLDGNITGIVGNRLIDSAYYRAGDKVVGAVADSFRNRILFAVYQPNGKHKIMLYDHASQTVTKVFADIDDTAGEAVLDLAATSSIQMNVLTRSDGEGDLLFFLNGTGIPSVINIEKTADGTRIPLSRKKANVIKAPPEDCPGVEYQNDTNRRANSLVNKLFKFRYRYVYLDNNKSVWSAISIMPTPKEVENEVDLSDPTFNNCIALSMNGGPVDVKKIEIAVSVSIGNGWSDFLMVDSLDKSDRDISNDTAFLYNFYNDGAYPAIDLTESILLFDYVPFTAGSQEIVNGNVPLYGDIVEGYDQTVIPDVRIKEYVEGFDTQQQSGTLNVVQRAVPEVAPNRYNYTFSGIPLPGTIVRFKILDVSNNVVLTLEYTTVTGDTVSTIVLYLAANIPFDPSSGSPYFIASGTVFNPSGNPDTFFIELKPAYQSLMQIVAPTSGSFDNTSRSTFLWGTKRRLGLVYYDENGVTNGVVTRINTVDSGLDSNLKDFEVTFAQYSEDAGVVQVPYISTQIWHLPPSWAKYYHWVITKNLTISSYLFWLTRDVKTDDDYVYLDVANIVYNKERNTGVADVLDYAYAKGDRVRLIRKQSDNTVYNDTYDAEIVGYQVNPKISGVEATGEFVKIKRTGIFADIDYTSKYFVIQLYTPYQITGDSNAIYYEFGQTFPIIETGGVRYHGGQYLDQSDVFPASAYFKSGDAYFRSRRVYLESEQDGFGFYNAMDNNFTDSYKSAVSSISGRPLLVDVNAKRTTFPSTIRFGGAYQPATVINGTNRFFAENFDDYNLSYGRIKRMKERDKTLRIFQERKCGMVPVYQQIIKDAVGNDVLAQSDKLLNKIQYYNGDYGIGDCPESLASNNFADYFIDNRRGVICRLSMDGLTPVSIVFEMNSWAILNLPLRGSGSKAVGVFDAEFNRYVLILEAAGDSPAETITFSENAKTAKGFESFVDFYPEYVVCLNTNLVAFKNGRLWIHDAEATPVNFFGTQYTPSITGVFNDNPQIKKNFTNIKTVSNKVWEPVEITTSLGQTSELLDIDFRKKEDSYVAGFLRDSGSPGGLLRGDHLKGNWIEVKFQATTPDTESGLVLSTVIANESQLNKR